MTITRSLLVTLTAIAGVSADIFVTAPLGKPGWQANDNSVITWQDSGSPPANTAIGQVQIFLAVGASTAQQKLVELGQADASDGNFPVPWPIITSMDIGDSSCFGLQFVPVNPASGAGMSFSPQFPISGLTNQFNASITSVVSSLAPQCIGNAAVAISSAPVSSSSALASSTLMSSSLPATATKNASSTSTSTSKPKTTSAVNGTKSAAMSLYPIHNAGIDIVLLMTALASMLVVAI